MANTDNYYDSTLQNFPILPSQHDKIQHINKLFQN